MFIPVYDVVSKVSLAPKEPPKPPQPKQSGGVLVKKPAQKNPEPKPAKPNASAMYTSSLKKSHRRGRRAY